MELLKLRRFFCGSVYHHKMESPNDACHKDPLRNLCAEITYRQLLNRTTTHVPKSLSTPLFKHDCNNSELLQNRLRYII